MSSIAPQKFQEMVSQLLYSLDMGDSLEGDLIPFLMRELAVSRKTVREAFLKAKTVFDARGALDEKIAATSESYALERIHKVERNVLRLALYELAHEEELSREQIISEALRLTRKFSTKEATTFVNAILDAKEDDDRAAPLSPQTPHSAE